ncbi:hypothetical protein [Tropicimonas sp. IMCC6043]|uniref:hypothetical protein n=1 Tax=Tropicimonas sp. IMCC6043 TaxID=2510645 RepID=UPI00101DEEEA|nr:hypothetical protein [Tropicimonas sp. IMCC6043]RYH11259.1 hypothetical protein EU800_05195 [Tropicimonas sp. IMCC6043]
MTEESAVEDIIGHLKHLIAAGDSTEAAREQARRYLARLETPLRIAFMGLADSDQPRLINALLETDLIPETGARPVQEVTFGSGAQVKVTHADGSVRDHEDLTGETLPEDAVFVQRHCEAPVLRHFTVLDLVIDGSQAERRAALRWAAAKADIAVWCSRSFTAAEQQFWRSVPERLMDHAFLLISQDTTGTRVRELKQSLASEFLDVFAIELADTETGTGDPAQRATPLRPLVEGLERHTADGRRADADMALIFLRKQGYRDPASAPAPSAAATPPEPRDAEILSLGIGPGSGADSFAGKAEVVRKDNAAIRSACAYIREQAIALLETSGQDGPKADFIARCGDMIRQLSFILDNAEERNDPAILALSDLLIEAEELVLLLEIEQDGAPAIDAASVLLQLRSEFESRLAA